MERLVIFCVFLTVFCQADGQSNQRPPPAARLNAIATSSTSVTVTWSPSYSAIPVQGYRVSYTARNSGGNYVMVSADARSVNLENLEPDKDYAISIRALNQVGLSRAISTNVHTPPHWSNGQSNQRPPAVSRLNAIATSSTSMNVTWSPGNAAIPVQGYRVDYRAGISHAYQIIVSADAQSVNLENLEPDTDIFISITAVNQVGVSRVFSTKVHTPVGYRSGGLPSSDGQSEQPPPPVSRLNAIATSSTSVTVTWSPSYSAIPVRGYRVTYTARNSGGNFVMVSADARSVNLENLKPDKGYAITIRAANQVGFSRAISTNVHTPPHWSDGQSNQRPPAVSRLNAIATTSTSVNVTWSPGDVAIPVQGYRVDYGAGISHVYQISVSADAQSVNLENLEPDTDYFISITAVNQVGVSRVFSTKVHTPPNQSEPDKDYAISIRAANQVGLSRAISTNVHTPPHWSDGQSHQLPPPVSRLNAIATTSTSVTVTWSPGDAAIPVQSYRVGYGAGISHVYKIIESADVQSVNLENLEPDTDYAISITAVNQVGVSRATFISVHTPPNQSEGQSHQIPPPVTHLNAMATTSTSVTVTWSPGNEAIPVQGYRVDYSTGISGVFHQLSVSADAQSIALTNLDPDTDYEISIRAFNQVGVSGAILTNVHTPPN